MENLMKITNAELVSSDKRARISGRVYIEYISNDNVVKGSLVQLKFGEITHYFETTDIFIDGENLKIKAREVGYWAKKFDNIKDFDLRNLIGLSVTKIVDPEVISKVHEMSCWC